MRSTLINLIGRMCAKETATDSRQSVAWQAHREAEQLSDLALLDELQAFVATSKSRDERQAAYFMLGALGVNADAPRCAWALVQRLPQEKDKYVLAGLLAALAKLEKPADLPLSGVLDLLSESRWLVRHAAITALQHARAPEIEPALLRHLASTADPFDMIYCHATLGGIGTALSLPALEAGCRSRKRDVKGSAEQAILAINARLASAWSAST